MILNILGSIAVLLASISSEPRDPNDKLFRIVCVVAILGAIWL